MAVGTFPIGDSTATSGSLNDELARRAKLAAMGTAGIQAGSIPTGDTGGLMRGTGTAGGGTATVDWNMGMPGTTFADTNMGMPGTTLPTRDPGTMPQLPGGGVDSTYDPNYRPSAGNLPPGWIVNEMGIAYDPNGAPGSMLKPAPDVKSPTSPSTTTTSGSIGGGIPTADAATVPFPGAGAGPATPLPTAGGGGGVPAVRVGPGVPTGTASGTGLGGFFGRAIPAVTGLSGSNQGVIAANVARFKRMGMSEPQAMALALRQSKAS